MEARWDLGKRRRGPWAASSTERRVSEARFTTLAAKRGLGPATLASMLLAETPQESEG